MSVKALARAPSSTAGWTAIVGLVALAFMQAVALYRENVNHMLLVISVVMAIYAGFLLRREYRRYELVSPLALYSFLVILHFALPGLLLSFGHIQFVDQDNFGTVGDAQIFVLVGFTFFHLGYATASRETHRIEILGKGLSVPWNSGRVMFVMLAFLTFGWLDRAYIVIQDAYFQLSRTTLGGLDESFHAVLRLGEQLPAYAMLIAWIWFWSKGSRRFSRWWWSGFTLWIAELVYWIPTGRKENVILTLILPIMIRYLFTRRLPSLRTGLATAVFILALFPAAYYYRLAMELGRFDSFAETIFSSANVIKEMSAEDVPEPLGVIVSRLSLLESVSASLRIVDSGVWQPLAGETYAWTVYSVVPRVFWAHKPGFHYGTAFGHAAGFIPETDEQTSISVTYFGEAYLNFMWLGVLVMFFIGIIFSLIYKRIFQSRFHTTWILLYAVTLPVILYVGGSFALYFSGLLQLLVILGVVGQFMSGKLLMSKTSRQGEPA